MKLKKKLSIELIEEYEKVNFYSPLFEGEQYNEFEKFLLTYKDIYPKDIAVIMSRLDKIAIDGVFERHFRYAGKVKDRTSELPSHFDTAKLRLYCICVSPQILILGNGGLKVTRTYNEDSQLNEFVNTLQKIDLVIDHRQKKYQITINGKTLVGDLSLYIDE